MNLLTIVLAAADGSEPAGGAAADQIAIATAGAAVLTVALLWVAVSHRNGRIKLVTRAAKLSEQISGLPGWAALPAGIAAAALIAAVFGMYWDISLHVAVGRDDGPLANPAHYFILAGLFGIFTAGVLAIVLPKQRPGAAAVRITRDWYAPLGGVLICACAAFALSGFPLDDMWHRIFGQDVTLWGPTHLMLIGGASMTLIGIATLVVEGLRADGTRAMLRRGRGAPARFMLWIPLFGGLLVALSTVQAEFDFGVPQFRQVFGPVMVMFAAALGLTAARIVGGRGTALGAAIFFLTVRGLLAVTVGPVLGQPTPHMPLYLVEALVVEAIALWIAPQRRPLAFGLASGAGIGTIGLAAEWGWTHVWMPIPWGTELLAEGVPFGLAAALCGALLGAWVANRLPVSPAPARTDLRVGAVVAAAGISVIVAVALYKPADSGVSGAVSLTPAGQGEVNAAVTLRPRDAADRAKWLTVTAWQGGGLRVAPLRRVGEGRYVTTAPVPVDGNWKSVVRLHVGRSLTALPLFLPEDRAIPAAEVPALPSMNRRFVADHRLLQREQKQDVSPALAPVGYAVVVGITLSLFALLAWGLHRLASGGVTPPAAPRRNATLARHPA